MGLTIGSRIIAETRIQNVGVRPVVGAYELMFPLYITVHGEEESSRWVSIAGARVTVKPNTGRQQQLGFARTDVPITIRPFSSTSRMTPDLALTLQPQQLLALEEMRAGGDLTFELQAVGQGFGGQHDERIEDTWRITVPQSDWIEKLRSAGVLDILLLEIPMPVGELSEEWSEIGRHLMLAQKHFYDGEYFACVSQCRLVIQDVGQKKYGDEDWAGPRLARLGGDRRVMTKDEREAAIYAVLRHFTHQAHHTKDEGGETEYTRPEARMILAQAAALVAHARGV